MGVVGVVVVKTVEDNSNTPTIIDRATMGATWTFTKNPQNTVCDRALLQVSVIGYDRNLVTASFLADEFHGTSNPRLPAVTFGVTEVLDCDFYGLLGIIPRGPA